MQDHTTLSKVPTDRDHSRRKLFDHNDLTVPSHYQNVLISSLTPAPELQFLYHAWGQVPPKAMAAACDFQYALYTRQGNYSWDVMFQQLMPEACQHIKRLMSVKDDVAIEFGHNSHEFMSRIISIAYERLLRSTTGSVQPLTIVTTDTEFYSMTRQLNRFQELASDRINIVIVPVTPLDTFTERFLTQCREMAPGSVDLVYVSHITFLQQTLFDDIIGFVDTVKGALQFTIPSERAQETIIVIDGYHSFGAIPSRFQDRDLNCIFLASALKHIGAGPNLAIALLPPKYSNLRPLLTGWLADVSVLGSTNAGIRMGSSVGYTPGLTLMGSTPSFLSSLVLFNETMRLWQSHDVTVDFVHQHVMQLQRMFLRGLATQKVAHPFINMTTLMRQESATYDDSEDLQGSLACLSHTLVFQQSCVEHAAQAVTELATQNIAIDSRKVYVRVGFGLAHNPEDIDKLLNALQQPSSLS